MGATHVTVAVSNPADPKRRWEALFLVDTGAIDGMAPAKHLREIGIEPEGKRTYELADGTEVVLDIGLARVEFMGEVVGATIIFGQDEVEPFSASARWNPSASKSIRETSDSNDCRRCG